MNINSPLEIISGVGPKYAHILKNHGAETVGDLLRITPYRYTDFGNVIKIKEAKNGFFAVIEGIVETCSVERTSRRRMFIVKSVISDESGQIAIIWFNQVYITNKIKKGDTVRLCGLVIADKKYGKVMRSPEIQTSLSAYPTPHYSEKTGLDSGRFAKIIRTILSIADQFEDPLPKHLIGEHKLMGLSQAIVTLHRPSSIKDVHIAKERLALDELWTLMTLAKISKVESGSLAAPEIKTDRAVMDKDEKTFPFLLTRDQKAAVNDILDDFNSQKPMRRLLNGDVGSGKTAVAFLAAKQIINNNLNAVFLAPTTVLANQHYQNWAKLFPEVNHIFITSGLCMINGEKISRSKMIQKMNESSASFICGTHAVFSGNLELEGRIGLVIVDEQHRFGVMQRAHLISNNARFAPHLLSMSATPIPRTAALVLYGDLDVSLLTEKPIGRKPVITRLASENGRPMVYQFIDRLINNGQQAYIVCPLIGQEDDDGEDSDNELKLVFVEEKKALLKEFEKLQKTVFSHRRIGLLHGRLKQQEKDDVLEQFRQGQLDILLSTSVVEVGVDVPNATVMLVESAEYFGLAQLHQLRGRVGRGDDQSFCFLFASEWTFHAKHRLELLVKYQDGFSLAEKDLAMRGPGEIYGTIQAGFSPFKYATLGDFRIVSKAQSIADSIAKIEAENWSPELKKWILEKQTAMHPE